MMITRRMLKQTVRTRKKIIDTVKIETQNNTTIELKDMNHSISKKRCTKIPQENFKCDKCDFISNKEITMNKHMNTKHIQKFSENECSLCEDRFTSVTELKKHIDEHIEEIETIDIASLSNAHDFFLM